jgi:protein-disulfide isomerase
MYRRFLVSLFQRCFVALLLLCLGCSAQSNSPTDLERRVERQLRAQFQVPDQVEIHLGQRTANREFSNYDNLVVTLSAGDKKQDLEFLISKDNKTLARLSKIDLTVDPYQEVMKKIDTSGRPWKGNKDAKVVVVSYDDFQCPFCTRMHQTLFNDVFKDYADKIKIVYKDFPLTQIHPWATHAAIDGNCLAAQNNDAYWAFADYVHANGHEISGSQNTPKKLPEQLDAVDRIARDQARKFNLDVNQLNACIQRQNEEPIRASVKEGESLGIHATPTLFINGQKIDGAVPSQTLRAALDRALKEAGQSAAGASASR